MNNNDRYWVWLQRAAGKGANLERLLAPFGGDVRALYEASPAEREDLLRGNGMKETPWHEEDLREQGVHGGRAAEPQEVLPGWGSASPQKKRRPVSPNTLAKMQKVSLSEADDVLEECFARGITVLTPEDEFYPPLLREIPTRPAVLYALGDVSLFTPAALPFAMVGARDARLTSLCAASTLAETLARAGLLVVSGGAIGTDSACHIGALNAGRPTVAVLGTGIGTNYLQQNADLRRVISKNGVLLTEMEPGEPGSLGSFPLRNRIIAGMSIGTLVVEAAVKSGSLITSRYAEEYFRDIFVPLFPGVDPTGVLGERFETYCAPPTTTPTDTILLTPDLPAASLAGGASLHKKRRPPLPKKYSSAFRGTRELLERDSGVGIRCAADVLASYAASYGLAPEDLAASGLVSAEALTRDITDLAGEFPPRLSQPMVLRARAQLGEDLPGGALNPNPGWGPYRTADDAARRVYTSAEFAARRGDHPHQSGLRRKTKEAGPEGTMPADAGPAVVELVQFQQELAATDTTPIAGALAISANGQKQSGGLRTGRLGSGQPQVGKQQAAECQARQPHAGRHKTGRLQVDQLATSQLQSGEQQEGQLQNHCPTFLKTKDQLDATSLLVLDEFLKDPSRPLYYGELADALDKAPQYLMAALTELQLAGYLDLLPDERYQLQQDPTSAS